MASTTMVETMLLNWTAKNNGSRREPLLHSKKLFIGTS